MIPSIAKLRELYAYDKDTGILTWKRNAYRNLRKIGDVAGSIVGNGYAMARVDGKAYGVHRIAYALMTGEWPRLEIDHIDGNRSNNAWNNLRLASRQENSYNQQVRSNNTSGHKGVFFHKAINKWWAYINAEKRRITIGYFDGLDQAISARKRAEVSLHGQFARQ